MQIPVRVLLVEDDPDITTLLQTALEPTFECLIARNGLEALQMALEGEPDLIVSDIMMPVLDGHEMIRRLRRYPELTDVPVIYLSALGSQDNIKKGYNLGAALYLTKPIDPARFKRNVELFASDHSITPKPKRQTARDVLQKFLIRKSLTPRPEPPHTAGSVSGMGGAARVRPAVKPSSSSHGTHSRQAAPAPPHPANEAPPVRRVVTGNARVSIPKPADAAKPEPPPVQEEPRVRLLLVESDIHFSQTLMAELMHEFDVLPAVDGIEAIERAARYQPDIFMIDSQITKINGYQLVMMLRKNAMFNNSPIIFASGKDNERDRQYVEKLGVQYFLSKPFDGPQLRKVIESCMNEPFFEIRRNRIGFKQALVELSTSENFSSAAGEALRVANVLRAESLPDKSRRDERDSWVS